MKLLSITSLALLIALFTNSCAQNQGNPTYEADWNSLSKAPVPKWWDDGKFGIFIHWGPYSVPGHRYKNKGYSEAITTDMYKRPELYQDFMLAKFGAHSPEFGYKDMVDLFTAENWNPEEWAELFKNSGAKYVIPTAEHHDGYALWDSELTEWCATKKGPMRDLVGDLGKAVRAQGLNYGLSYHRERHPNRYTKEFTVVGEPFPLILEEIEKAPSAAGLYGPFEYSDEFIADYVARWKELEEKYDPDFMWIDDNPIFYRAEGDPQVIKYEEAFKGMIADYLNRAERNNKEVYFNNKGKKLNWPMGVGCIEKDNLQLDTIGPRFQNPATIGKSYAYMAYEEENDLYKSSKELIRLLCDVVSKNGNLLLNIGPKADGTIPEMQKQSLLEMGEWLKVHGEAIYGTTPWKTYGEYSGEIIEEDFVIYDKHSQRIHEQEIRYTAKENTIYAFVYIEPGTNLTLESFTNSNEMLISNIHVMGNEDTEVDWKSSDKGLELTFDNSFTFDKVGVLKISYLN